MAYEQSVVQLWLQNHLYFLPTFIHSGSRFRVVACIKIVDNGIQYNCIAVPYQQTDKQFRRFAIELICLR